MTSYQYRKFHIDDSPIDAKGCDRGTKKVKYLDDNVGAVEVKLSPAEVEVIRKEIEKVEIVGDRYPPFLAQYSFADTPEP